MKIWIYVLIGLGLLFLVVGYLDDQGILNVKWQWLTVAISLLAGPFKLVKGWLTGNKSKVDDILTKNKATQKEEVVHRETFDKDISDKKAKIDELQKKIDLLDTKIQTLDEKKNNVDKEVNNMSLDETKNEFEEVYG